MAYVVRMPKLGVEMERGVVVEWAVDVDDAVEEGDLLAEIESEKTVSEVTAREGGVLRRVYLAEDEEAPPGTPMGIVAGADEDVDDLTAEAEAEVEDGTDAAAGGDPESVDASATGDDPDPDGTGAAGESAPGAADQPAPDPGADVAPRTDDGTIMATPKARKLAEESGVALASVSGSGPRGSITAADVADADAGGSATRTVSEERPLSSMRSTIADRLGRSHREAPHVTVDREVDVEAAFAAVGRADAAADADVAITDVVLAAVSATLSDHPAFNATFDAETAVHTLYEEHNVGVAVDVEGGLLTPVLADLRGTSPGDIAAARRRVVGRVLDGDQDADDLSGGTFTVSNLGAFGSDSFTPIINPPEVAILGVNRVRERPVNTDAGIEFRRHVTFSLSFDHRVVDGADAARFLATLDEHLAAAADLLA